MTTSTTLSTPNTTSLTPHPYGNTSCQKAQYISLTNKQDDARVGVRGGVERGFQQ